ncbi:hypothetical protein AAMO2058_001423400 [Amorphochlora amoebiformis]
MATESEVIGAQDPEVDVFEPEQENDKLIGHEREHKAAEEDEKFEIKWLKYTLIMGIPPALTERQWRVFALLSLAGFFSVYDDVLRAVCIDDIQRSLDISEMDLPFIITIIRIGAIPSFLLTLMADMMGRRPLLLITISMYTLCTALTAVSFDVYWFTISQFFGKLFLMAEFLISNVAIIEEFDTGTRGWAMGALGSIATAGGGFALCLYAGAAGSDYGWRILYVLGVLPLAMLTYLRKGLPETRHFHDRQRGGAELQMLQAEGCERCGLAFSALWIPLKRLFETTPIRTMMFSSLVLMFGISSHAAAFYQFKYLQEERSYSAVDVFLLGVFGGITAITLFALLGAASDKYGRRPFLITAYVVFFTCCIMFFNVVNQVVIPVVWILFAGTGFGLEILNMTIISESFHTESRATAQGVTTVAYVLGTIFGLLIEGLIYSQNQSHSEAITYLAIAGFTCPVIAVFLPETSREHLD